MTQVGNILSFPSGSSQGHALVQRGILVFPLAEGSKTDNLFPLYRVAMGNTELQPDPAGQLTQTFETAGAVRLAAVNARVSRPPIGFALAVPVKTRQELADTLAVNVMQPFMETELEGRQSWALLVTVDISVRRMGIGRTIANRALDEIVAAGGERVFLAASSRDLQVGSFLARCGFTRCGLSRERSPRALYSRGTDFRF